MLQESIDQLVRTATEESFVPFTVDPNVDSRDEGFACTLISRDINRAHWSPGSDGLAVGLARILPGQYHLKHHHPSGAEFYVITKGNCLVQIRGQSVRAIYGTAIYIPRNAVHSIKNDTDGTCELIWGIDRPTYEECGIVYDE
jgi:quercetin dioxygenase-like cupin family protein